MSLFDQIGSLLGNGSDNNLLGAANTLLEQNGGVSGLVDKFQNGGLGDIVSSWVGTGNNLSITPEQITAVLGQPQIAAFADKLGIDSEQVSQKLAEHLPTLIDTLTPNGQIPEGSPSLAQGLELVKGLFGRG